LNRALAWLLGAVLLLAGCATQGPQFIPKSPFLDVPLSTRAHDPAMAQHLAELEIKQDWTAMAALAAPLVARDPAGSDWRIILGYARLQQQEYGGAVEALAPVVERSPEEVDAHNLLGEALRLSGQRERARQTLERASFLHTHSQVTRFLLGQLYQDENQFERAKQAYGEAVRLDPDFPPAWLGLVSVLAKVGRRDEYDVALERLKTLDPAMARTAPGFAGR
jgi:cytochrome c-type biogenesis protein CcmH/NrfG